MKRRILTKEDFEGFRDYLILEEKSETTIEKYCRDVRTFADYCYTTYFMVFSTDCNNCGSMLTNNLLSDLNV